MSGRDLPWAAHLVGRVPVCVCGLTCGCLPAYEEAAGTEGGGGGGWDAGGEGLAQEAGDCLTWADVQGSVRLRMWALASVSGLPALVPTSWALEKFRCLFLKRGIHTYRERR